MVKQGQNAGGSATDQVPKQSVAPAIRFLNGGSRGLGIGEIGHPGRVGLNHGDIVEHFLVVNIRDETRLFRYS